MEKSKSNETNESNKRRIQRDAVPLPTELTAEWTVKAHLRFARAGESVRRTFSSCDPVNPVRIVYKWSTLESAGNLSSPDEPATTTEDVDLDEADDGEFDTSYHCRKTFSREPLKKNDIEKSTLSKKRPPSESFRSTASSISGGGGIRRGAEDSAFSGSNASNKKIPISTTALEGKDADRKEIGSYPSIGTRCRSTCNIVVSAVADFLPTLEDLADNEMEEGHRGVMTAMAADNKLSQKNDILDVNKDLQKLAEVTPIEKKTMLDEEKGQIQLESAPLCQVITTTNRKKSTEMAEIFVRNLSNLRDATCQTSDTESKYLEESIEYERQRRNLSSMERGNDYHQKRRPGDLRADYKISHPSTLFTPAVNQKAFVPSTTPHQTFKSASFPRMPFLTPTIGKSSRGTSGGEGVGLSSLVNPEVSKKPRTVHIDVYCTGSEEDEDENQAEDEESSDKEVGSDSDNQEDRIRRAIDLASSNSTFQTVLDNEQMRLRHQRITDNQILPRRLQQSLSLSAKKAESLHRQSSLKLSSLSSNTAAKSVIKSMSEIDQFMRMEAEEQHKQQEQQLLYGLNKLSTSDEINESKQLLFRKHIGDQKAVKLQNLRQKYQRQTSDDALSGSYPNSSRSTLRDNTCSSISSTLAAVANENDDHPFDQTGLLWRPEEGDDFCSLGKSESFEYDNSVDRLRIRQMDKHIWTKSSNKSENEPTTTTCLSPSVLGQGHLLQTITEDPNTNYPLNYNVLSSEIAESNQPSLTLSSGLPSSFNTYEDGNSFSPNSYSQMQNRPGFLQFFGPQCQQEQSKQSEQLHSAPITANYLYPKYPSVAGLQRWKSEAQDNLSAEGSPISFLTPSEHSRRNSPFVDYNRRITPTSGIRCVSEAPSTTSAPPMGMASMSSSSSVRRFYMMQSPNLLNQRDHIKTDLTMPSMPFPVGYSREYLEKARRFGDVVVARKPGHHIGPTKNPSCLCESCQRWLLERLQPRHRAFSLDERPPPKFYKRL